MASPCKTKASAKRWPVNIETLTVGLPERDAFHALLIAEQQHIGAPLGK